MTSNEVIGSIVVGLFGLGGTGWAIVAYAINLRDKILAHAARLEEFAKSCEDCRKTVERRLSAGTTEFEEIDADLNKTKLDLLSIVNQTAEVNHKYREQSMKDFVAEQNLEGKVVLIMRKNCRNCRGES